MTFYSIKQWETRGIVAWEGQLCESNPNYAHNGSRLYGKRFERIGKDSFSNVASAIAEAETLRDKAVISATKRIQRLRAIKFDEIRSE